MHVVEVGQTRVGILTNGISGCQVLQGALSRQYTGASTLSEMS